MNDKQKLALWVDGSSYLFRAFHALPPLTGPQGRATGAVYGVVNMLRGLLHKEHPDYFAVVFDPAGKNFRHRMYPDYKSQRPPMPNDLREQIEPTFDLIKALGFPLLQINDYEADDVIATLSRQALHHNAQVLIATGDKDLMQLVSERVHLLDTMKKGGGKRVDPDAVKEKFKVMPEQMVDYLALCGDKSDNIPGVRGVGPKTAADWLGRYTTLDRLLAHADELKGKNAENLKQAAHELPLYRRLVTIRQDVPMERDFSTLQRSPADHEALRKLYQELGFVSWLSELKEPLPLTTSAEADEESHELILTEQSLERWLKKLRAARRFTFFLQTDSADYMRAEIVGFAFALPSRLSAYVPVAHRRPSFGQLDCREVLRMIKPLLIDPQIAKLGCNVKFMRKVLLHHDIELAGIGDDLALASYTHNAVACRHDLASMAARYLSSCNANGLTANDKKPKRFSQWAVHAMGSFTARTMNAAQDLDIFFKRALSAQPEHQRWYEEVEMPLLTVLSDVEHHGVMVDTKTLAKQSARLGEKITHLEETIYQQAGRSFNLDSPDQVAKVLFDEQGLPPQRKTATGKASTAEDVLEKLALEFDLPRFILDCRGLKKLKSSFVDKLIKMVSSRTHRVHTSYQQALTATGRLSSSNPNLQNVPVRGREGHRIREAFVAAPGHCILSADYSQIELRIIAHLSGDKNMLSAFKNHEDVHTTTAAEVFGLKSERVNQRQRRFAKAVNFGLIYGMGAYSLAKQLGVSRGEAQAYVDAYFAHYPKIKEYMQRTKEYAHTHGYVKTLFGRRLYMPDIKSRNARLRQHAERAAINAPMQGTAADVIKRAMVDLHHFLKQSTSAAIVVQVHDELVLEVAHAELELVKKECCARMAAAADLSIALTVDLKVGDNWGLHGVA